jgi:hypothetical protein
MKKITSRTIALLTGLSLLATTIIAGAAPVSAESFTAQTLTAAACTAQINRGSSMTMDVTPNQTSNVTVLNVDTVVAQNVSGPGVPDGTQLAASNGSASTSKTIIVSVGTSPVTISFTPIPTNYSGPDTNDCPIGSTPVAATYTFRPVAPTTPPASSGSSTSSNNGSSSTAAKTSTPAAATTTPTTTTPATSSDTGKVTAVLTPTPQKTGLSTNAKLAFAAAVLAGTALGVACALGYIPYQKYCQKLFGKKSKPVKGKAKRRQRKK